MIALMLGGPASAPAAAMGGAPRSEPVVDGVALETVVVAGWPIHHDREVPAEALSAAGAAFASSLETVPRVTGLPTFSTPLAVYLLADQERFRAALEEIGRVRIELVALEVGGYTIERDGTMLIFFPYQAVDDPTSATIGFGHELAHLAVREASARRPVPQWLNEGFAQWVSYAVLRETDPIEAEEQFAIDRAVVASALHGETGLLPWASLVNRTRFSRAGTEGWGGLAYGQSTLFVDWLARRHGVGALGTFLQRIGEGEGATAAFQAAIGPFAPEEAAFRASLDPLRDELRPGLRRLTAQPRSGRPLRYALIGGAANERVVVESFLNGETLRRLDFAVDPAGFTVVGLSAETVTRPGHKLLRVSSQTLGTLEVEIRPDGTVVEGTPRPAPVQLPRRVGRVSLPTRIAAWRPYEHAAGRSAPQQPNLSRESPPEIEIELPAPTPNASSAQWEGRSQAGSTSEVAASRTACASRFWPPDPPGGDFVNSVHSVRGGMGVAGPQPTIRTHTQQDQADGSVVGRRARLFLKYVIVWPQL